MPIAYSSDIDQAPAVAYNEVTDSFIIVYERVTNSQVDILMREVAVAQGAANYLLEELGDSVRKYRENPAGDEWSISGWGTDEYQPDVSCAHDGSGKCHVAWSQKVNAADRRIKSVTITPVGGAPHTWSVGTTVTLSTTNDMHTHPAVAAQSGDTYAVVWYNDDLDDVLMSWVDAVVPSATNPLTVSSAALEQPDIEATNSDGGQAARYLVGWRGSDNRLRAELFDDAGSSIDIGMPGAADDIIVLKSATDYSPTIAYDDVNNRWVVQWWHDGTGGGGDLDGYYKARITTTGSVTTAATLVSQASWDTAGGAGPGGPGTYGTSTPPGGAPVRDAGGAVAEMLVSAVEGTAHNIEVLVPSQLTTDPYVTKTISHQTIPGVAYRANTAVNDPGEYVLVWADQLGSNVLSPTSSTIQATVGVVDAVGDMSFSDGVGGGTIKQLNDTVGASSTGYAPAVAWDGSRYFVVWVDRRGGGVQTDLYARYFTPGGAPVWSNEVLVKALSNVAIIMSDSKPSVPAVACADGAAPNECLIVYAWFDSGPGRWKIMAQQFRNGAAVGGPGLAGNPLTITTAAAANEEVRDPAVFFDSDDWLIAYSRKPAGSQSMVEVAYVKRDNSALQNLAGNPNPFVASDETLGGNGNDDERPSIAALSPSNMLVVWQSGPMDPALDPRVNAGNWDIVGRRCANGVCDALPVAAISQEPTNDQFSPWLIPEDNAVADGFWGYKVAYLSTYTASSSGLVARVRALDQFGGQGKEIKVPPPDMAIANRDVRHYWYSGEETQLRQRPVIANNHGHWGKAVLIHDAPLESTCRTRAVVSSLDLGL